MSVIQPVAMQNTHVCTQEAVPAKDRLPEDLEKKKASCDSLTTLSFKNVRVDEVTRTLSKVEGFRSLCDICDTGMTARLTDKCGQYGATVHSGQSCAHACPGVYATRFNSRCSGKAPRWIVCASNSGL